MKWCSGDWCVVKLCNAGCGVVRSDVVRGLGLVWCSAGTGVVWCVV